VNTIETLEYRYNIKSKEMALSKAENNLRNLQADLDELTGTENAEVEYSLVHSDPYSIDVYKAYDSALENDIGLYASYRNMKASEMTFEIAKYFYSPMNVNYLSNLEAYEKSKAAYEKYLKTLKVNILNSINDLKTRYDSIKLEEMNLLIKKENLEAAIKRYDLGMVTKAAVETARAAYEASELQVFSKTAAYIKAERTFRIETGYNY
jgi:outer membrane protein TolC